MQVVERPELAVDGPVPIGQMEARGGGLVDPGEMPIAEELAEVRQLVAELAEDIGAPAQRSVAEVAVAALTRGVEAPVGGAISL